MKGPNVDDANVVSRVDVNHLSVNPRPIVTQKQSEPTPRTSKPQSNTYDVALYDTTSDNPHQSALSKMQTKRTSTT